MEPFLPMWSPRLLIPVECTGGEDRQLINIESGRQAAMVALLIMLHMQLHHAHLPATAARQARFTALPLVHPPSTIKHSDTLRVMHTTAISVHNQPQRAALFTVMYILALPAVDSLVMDRITPALLGLTARQLLLNPLG